MNVLLGVTGSIAAYKAAEVVSALRKAGVNVTVVMTESAARLVGPATFRALSGNPVRVDLWEEVSGRPVHIDMAVEQDVVAVAPATANIIGKAANGICDDLLSTILMTTRAPVIFAPAMNENMFLNAAVQENIRKLKERGCIFVEPGRGWLACGVEGVGRLADPEVIVESIMAAGGSGGAGPTGTAGRGGEAAGGAGLSGEREAGTREPDRRAPGAGLGGESAPRKIERDQPALGTRGGRDGAPVAGSTRADLSGRKVVVTGGPTREAIDAVRFISNRSSGRMAVALARAAAGRGAETVLISGPRSVPAPGGVRVVDVETGAEMRKAIEKEWPDADVVVMAAAVCDFKPERVLAGKMKRGKSLDLKMVSTEDIIAGFAREKAGKVVTGFAVETADEVKAGKAKLKAKHLDLIFVNNPERDGCGFGSDHNAGFLIDARGEVTEIGLVTKADLAEKILDRAAALLD